MEESRADDDSEGETLSYLPYSLQASASVISVEVIRRLCVEI